MVKEKHNGNGNGKGTVAPQQTESMARVIFSLEEPWRSRFLWWLSERANGEYGHQLPSRTQVAGWRDDMDLSREVALLLNKWLGKTM